MAFNLRNSGYDVDISSTGEGALEAVAARSYDLILLDVMLPGIDGLEVARRLRASGNTEPILMITARDRADDTIAGLDAGADDYITKPFDLDEVLARIRVTLRRQVWGRADFTSASPEHLRYGSWEIDFRTYVATHSDGREIRLTAKEAAVLRVLASRSGEVMTREALLEEVWGLPGSLETRTVDNFIRKLRHAFEDDPGAPKHILSVRGVGYYFAP